jgi:diguanylate cyclase (GGDEF)-like protein
MEELVFDLDANLEQKLRRCRTLPSPPKIAIQLLQVCQDPVLKLSDLAHLIEKDPSLTAKILRIVNSPLYGVSREISTLTRAIALLGVNAIRTIALSYSFTRTLSAQTRELFDHSHYWQRSLLAAVSSQKLAKIKGFPNTEELFLAGLLQDIGILALSKALGEVYGAIVTMADQDHNRLQELEQEYLNADHSQVGAWLMDKWKLPLFFQQAAFNSHKPNDTVEVEGQDSNSLGQSTKCVFVSSYIADIWTSEDIPRNCEQAFTTAHETVGIDRTQFEALLSDITSTLPEISSLYEVDFPQQEEIDAILEEAKEALLSFSLNLAQELRKQETVVVSLSSRNRQLKEIAQRDGLTKLYNRAYFDEVIADEFRSAALTGAPLSVIMCDLDRFKRVNDTKGHLAGDQVLQIVSEMVAENVRTKDLAARYGGEEFVLVLVDADSQTAAAVSERIRHSVETREFEIGNNDTVRITLSAGYATQESNGPFRHPDELVQAADRCMYLAKEAGRNCVVGGKELGQCAS